MTISRNCCPAFFGAAPALRRGAFHSAIVDDGCSRRNIAFCSAPSARQNRRAAVCPNGQLGPQDLGETLGAAPAHHPVAL
jgi:hypothetical protein